MQFKLLLKFFILTLVLTSNTFAQECSVSLKDIHNSVESVVESCENIGSFSVGGTYEGEIQKLTYLFPKPWKGTFITVEVDGEFYSSSLTTENSSLLDDYVFEKPSVFGNSIITSWRLPEKINVIQRLTLFENYTLIGISLRNEGIKSHSLGVRIHFDTLIGFNDGAPIYIPGKGLHTREKTYTGGDINFGYWKAYNKPWNPTIVSSGLINPVENFTLPDRITISEWKKSKNSVWDYKVNESTSIQGDSAVMLYYVIDELKPNQEKEVTTGYGSSPPVLPLEKGEWGLTEIMTDDIYGRYCPGETIEFTIDGISSRLDETGFVSLTTSFSGTTIFKNESIQVFNAGRVIQTRFNVTLPLVEGDIEIDVKASLLNQEHQIVDEVLKKKIAFVDYSNCIPIKTRETSEWGPLIILIILILFVLALIFLALLKIYRGKILLEKQITPGEVKVIVRNNTRKTLTEVEIIEPIPRGAEIDVETLAVKRKEDFMHWIIGDIPKGEEAILEYSIKIREPEKGTRLVWNGGEKVLE